MRPRRHRARRWLDKQANTSAATMTSVETSASMPHACHDDRTTTVMGSHSKALQMVSELGTSRPALTVKCPPKQPIAGELLYV